MKKFTRQTSGNAPTADVNLDFGAAGAKVARLFEPGEYQLPTSERPKHGATPASIWGRLSPTDEDSQC